MKVIISVLLFLFCMTGPLRSQQVPKTIPDFTFYRLNNTPFANKDLARDKLIFFVFFDPGCDHCQHAIHYIDEHHQEFRKSAIYLVTMDDKERISQFMDRFAQNLKKEANITILRDVNREFIVKFQPRKFPGMYLYTAQRKLEIFDDNEQNIPVFLRRINVPDN